MSRKTTVTHPDGTVSKRTSQNAIYAFAVETTVDRWEEAGQLRRLADENDVEAERLRTAFSADDVIEESRPWMYGGTRVNVTLRAHDGGKNKWIGAYMLDENGVVKNREGNEDAANESEWRAAKIAEYIVAEHRYAAQNRERAATLDAGPQFTYHIARWSRSAALAEKGSNEFRNSRYANVRVVPVDEEA